MQAKLCHPQTLVSFFLLLGIATVTAAHNPGEERTVIDMQDDLISQVRRDPAAATERARIARTIPHLLLLEAANQKANLRRIGNQDYAGKQHDVIGFPLPNTKITLALFLTSDTHLLSKYEYTMDFPGLGDALVEFVYTGYKNDSKLGHAPTGYKIFVGGQLRRHHVTVQIEINEKRKFPSGVTSSVAGK